MVIHKLLTLKQVLLLFISNFVLFRTIYLKLYAKYYYRASLPFYFEKLGYSNVFAANNKLSVFFKMHMLVTANFRKAGLLTEENIVRFFLLSLKIIDHG